MKLKLLPFYFSLLSGVAFGQSSSVLERTKLALKSGNSQQMGQMMADKIQYGYEGEAKVMTTKEAVTQLAGFYKSNPVAELTQLFQGQSKDGKQYFIGLLKTRNGIFRCSVYWIESPKSQILSMDISKE